MRRKSLTKRVSLQRNIELPSAGAASALRIHGDGRIELVDHDGNIVTPKTDERATFYERPKGVKYQSKSVVNGAYASLNGLEELAQLESFFVIDTNTVEIQEDTVSVAFFMQCKVTKEDGKFRCSEYESSAHAFEFHNIQGNPEMLAILAVANANSSRMSAFPDTKIGFITDSDLGHHAAISNRERPIYGDHFLPPGFSLMYASSDTGKELINVLIRKCDQVATSVLEELQVEGLSKSGYLSFPNLPGVRYHYRRFPDFKVDSGLVDGTTVPPGSNYKIQFFE